MDTPLYFRQFMVLVAGTAAAQLVNLAAYPLLTRLYTPSDFGLFALFVTIAGVIGPVAAGRFDLIVQSARDSELVPVYGLSQIVNAGVSILSVMGLLIYSSLTDAALRVDHALLLGLAVFLTGFCNSSALFLIRHQRYTTSTRAAFARALLTVVAQILLFFVWPNPDGLILGFCIGFLGQAAVLAWSLRRYSWRLPRKLHLRAVWKRHRPQAMVDVPGTIVGALALNVLNFFLLALYSTVQVGYYALAFRVAVVPLVLFSGSLSEVFYQKATASFRKTGTFWNELRFNLISSTLLSVAIFVPLIFLARPLFSLVFDDEWLPAADILIYLTPMLAARFVCTSIQSTPLVIGRPHWLFANNVGLIVAMGAAFLLAERFSLSLKAYLLLNTALMSAVYLAFTLYIVVMVRRRYRQPPATA